MSIEGSDKQWCCAIIRPCHVNVGAMGQEILKEKFKPFIIWNGLEDGMRDAKFFVPLSQFIMSIQESELVISFPFIFSVISHYEFFWCYRNISYASICCCLNQAL